MLEGCKSQGYWQAHMHALTTRAITHDSTTFETNPLDPCALGLQASCNNHKQPVVSTIKRQTRRFQKPPCGTLQQRGTPDELWHASCGARPSKAIAPNLVTSTNRCMSPCTCAVHTVAWDNRANCTHHNAQIVSSCCTPTTG